MKSYTDIEQSKKLAEILPLESADHHYVRKTCDFMGNLVDGKWSEPKYGNPESSYAHYVVQNFTSYEIVPCWSLAALLELISEPILSSNGTTWSCATFENNHFKDDCFSDNPVDVCYEMIIKLKEKGLL